MLRAPPALCTLSLPDALPISAPARLLAEYVAQLPSEPMRLVLDSPGKRLRATCGRFDASLSTADPDDFPVLPPTDQSRSEEHTSELQSPCNLVCRLLLEKKTQ